ncbi:MAG: twitching motility protein PilJ [Arenicella sp.]|jgi:twitching motility protein PilJ
MSEDKLIEKNDLNQQLIDPHSDDAAQLYDADTDVPFDGFDDLDLGLSDTRAVNPESSEKLWLYLGLAALLLAALLRLIVSPVLDTQRQRVNQTGDVVQKIGLTNAAAVQSLTTLGSYKPVEKNLTELTESVSSIVLPVSSTQRAANKIFGNAELNAELSSAIDSYRESAQVVISQGPAVESLKEKLSAVTEEINGSVSDTILFVEAVATEGRSKRTEKVKNRYLFLTEEAANINGLLSRLSGAIGGYFVPGANLEQLADEQNTNIIRIKDTLTRITGNAAAVVATAAEPLRVKFVAIESRLFDIGDRSSVITQSHMALAAMQSEAESLRSIAQGAQNQSQLVRLIDLLNNILPIILVAFGILAMWRFFASQNLELVASEGSLSDALADQQESILKLLDEMSALADGDLTVEAEVTDQITGAIADSVNFAVIEMRELVSQINRASLEVANESALAVNNSQAVSLSNMQQAEQITAAAKDMQRVTHSMREMSEQAHSSSEMATESINVANKGAQAVRDTIDGMNNMREQIQDTSKRIKRLGESSQRIGDIVALIDDIAEQTNILSLNAAIQASMAGEAGRGFAVVSDEVQSLAERSTEATKKIAELVTTIQNDTNDAVQSMEKATQQVVAGTRVADTAGSALAEIEDASSRLSILIGTISQRSSQQAQVVTEVAEQVTVISDSSVETSRKAQDSANSIAKLLELAKELETSVSRFKLPAN